MIADIIKFLVERWRRSKYKEDYEAEAKIKVDAKNRIIQYKLQDKETYAVYDWPNLVVTSIDLWSTGEAISQSEKSLILIDLLDYIYNYAGKKARLLIEKNHPDKAYWEGQASRLSYNIESVELFDEEEAFQAYLNELSKVFEQGQVLEINGKVIENRADLEAQLRDNKKA